MCVCVLKSANITSGNFHSVVSCVRSKTNQVISYAN